MSTIVCQGLQSCLESQLVEQRTTLRLKLASPKPLFSQFPGFDVKSSVLDSNIQESEEEKCHHKQYSKSTISPANTHLSSNPDLGCWSFIQALSNGSHNPKDEMEKETSYVHPQVKRSLSEKSLELCTENLGSETGTDIIEDSIFSLPLSDSEGGNSPTREQTKPRQFPGRRKESSRSFPPPLTTISGSDSFQFRPHREGGRLIIKAVVGPTAHTYFQAERSHGRLRLCFMKNYCARNFDSEEAAEESEGKSEDNESESFENEGNDEEEEEEAEEDPEFEEQQEEEECDECLSEEMDSNSLDFGVEVGMEKFQRPSRCKERGRGNENLISWESFWVATS